MPTTIDSLQIEIGASATSANRALDGLVSRLTTLKNSLGGGNFSGMQAMALGLKNISSAMQSLSGMHMPDYNRVAKGIERLGSVNVGGINATAQSIQALGNALNSTNLAQPSAQIVTLASSFAKLGGKNVSTAITNIPKLALAFNQLLETLSHAPAISRNVVSIAQSMATIASSGGKVSIATTKSARGLSLFAASAKKAKSSTGGLAAAIGKIYASYWLLFRLFSKFKKAIDISSSLTEIQNVISHTFDQAGIGKLNEFLDDSITKFGMSELSAKKYAARFQALGSAMKISSSSIGKANEFLNSRTNDYVGLSDSMGDVSINLTKLTADIASFYDMAQSDVAEDLQAIFTGMTKPLRKYGLDLTQATLKEWALRNGLDADIKKMSQAEKTMLRYQYVLANTTQLQGDFERTSKTWHNQVTILKAGFEQLANIVGTILINAFKGLLITVNQAMTGVISAMQNVLNALGQIFGWTVEVDMGGLVQDAEDYSDALEDASDSSKKLKANLLGIDELNVLSDKNSGSGSGSDIASGADTDKILSVNKSESVPYESWIKDLETLGSAIGDKLTSVLNGINWDSVYQGAKDFGTGLANFLNGLISPELFGAVGRTIAKSLNTAIYASLSFATTFDWEEFGLSIAEGVNEFFRTFDFGALGEDIATWVKGIWKTIKTVAQNIDWGDVFKGVFDFFKELDIETVGLIVGYITIKKISGVVLGEAVVGSIGKKIAGVIGTAITTAWTTKIVPRLGYFIETAFSGVGVGEAFKTAFGKVPAIFTGITVAIGGAALAVVNFLDMWNNGFSIANELLMVLGTTLGVVGAILLGAPAVVAGVVGGIIAAIGTIAILIHDNWDSVYSYVTYHLQDIQARVNGFVAKTKEKLLGLFEPVRKKMEEFGNWVKNIFAPLTELTFGDLFTAVQNLAKGCANGIIGFFEKAVNGIIDGINGFFGFLNSGISWVNDVTNQSFGTIQLINHVSIPKFANGGFPEVGSLFLAGEAGAEMVGNINGKTGVASGAEITGIRDAIYDSSNQESSLLAQAVSLLNEIASKDMSVELDGRELVSAVNNRSSRNGFSFA